MSRKGSKLRSIGTYFLAGSLAVGSAAYAQQDVLKNNPLAPRPESWDGIPLLYQDTKDTTHKNISDATPINPEKSQNLIYAEAELTSAGDGVLAKSYVTEVNVSPDNEYSLKSKFSSKDKIKYFFTDARKGLERIVKKMGRDSKLTGKEKAIKYYLRGLARKLRSNDKASLKLLNTAVKDGIISPEEDGLYNEKGWKVKDDVYMAVVKTKSQETPLLLYFRPKTYAEARKKEGRLEQEIKKEAKPEETRQADAKMSSASVAELEKKDSSETITKYEKEKQEAGRDNLRVKEPVISDSLETKESIFIDSSATEKPFIEVIDGILQLLKPYDSLTTEQKKEYQMEYANFWGAKDIVGVNPELYVVIEDSTKEEEAKPEKNAGGPGFGLEAGVGNNGEKTVGVFGDVPLTSWLKLGAYANYSAARGNSYSYDERTEITQRERQLIGPATYKQRTDEITTTLEDMARAEVGAGITLKISENVEIPFRVGAKILNEKEIKEGKSTIVHERNAQILGEAKTITGQTESDSPVNRLSLSAGAIYNINKNLAVGAEFNRTGNYNQGQVNLRVGF